MISARERMKSKGNPPYEPYSQGNPSQVIFRSLRSSLGNPLKAGLEIANYCYDDLIS